jgi:hypothetical protein
MLSAGRQYAYYLLVKVMYIVVPKASNLAIVVRGIQRHALIIVVRGRKIAGTTSRQNLNVTVRCKIVPVHPLHHRYPAIHQPPLRGRTHLPCLFPAPVPTLPRIFIGILATEHGMVHIRFAQQTQTVSAQYLIWLANRPAKLVIVINSMWLLMVSSQTDAG